MFVNQRDDFELTTNRIVVFPLRVANSTCVDRAIPSANYEEIVVAVVNDPFNERELFLVGGWK